MTIAHTLPAIYIPCLREKPTHFYFGQTIVVNCKLFVYSGNGGNQAIAYIPVYSKNNLLCKKKKKVPFVFNMTSNCAVAISKSVGQTEKTLISTDFQRTKVAETLESRNANVKTI